MSLVSFIPDRHATKKDHPERLEYSEVFFYILSQQKKVLLPLYFRVLDLDCQDISVPTNKSVEVFCVYDKLIK